MKNLKNFQEFAEDKGLNEYYTNFNYSLPKERSTKLGQKLEDIRSNIRREMDRKYGFGTNTGFQMDTLDSPGYLLGSIFSGLAGAASGAAEILSPRGKKGLIKNPKAEDSRSEVEIEKWGEKLGPRTTEKDLENFAKKSEEIALRRYGKDWSYNNPKTPDQRKFANLIRKREEELAGNLRR